MRVRFAGISEVKFITPTGEPIPKRDLVNTAFYWEQEADLAREVFVKRGRVFCLNDADEPDRTTHRELVQGVLSEEISLPGRVHDALTGIAQNTKRLARRIRKTFRDSGEVVTLKSFEEGCVARFDTDGNKRTITVTVTRNGPDDVTFETHRK